MEEDNFTRQADEVEAVAAIYDEQWHVISEASRTFSIDISDEKDNSHSLTLTLTLPVDYPSSAPPQYELSAPWLRGPDRLLIQNQLEEIYCDNLGESIIYLWVEKIREFVVDFITRAQDEDKTAEITSDELARRLFQGSESEEDDEEDNFDPSIVDKTHSGSAYPAMEEEQDLELPEIFHGEFVHDRKSVFQAHLAEVHHVKQVEMVMNTLRENKKIAAATHRIEAYRIEKVKNGHRIAVHGCVDDGEIHAGSRMLHLLQIVDAKNVLVVVTRWYGGVHLGPDRYKHINNCTRQILHDHGYIKDREEKKKGPKSRKKGK